MFLKTRLLVFNQSINIEIKISFFFCNAVPACLKYYSMNEVYKCFSCCEIKPIDNKQQT